MSNKSAESVRIIEVARMLGVSKVTIYKKIEKNPETLGTCIRYIGGIRHITAEGVDMLKSMLHREVRSDREDLTQDQLRELYDFLTQAVQERKKVLLEKEMMNRHLSGLKKDDERSNIEDVQNGMPGQQKSE